jgi:probable F420-dependent oxidoreductase
MRIGVVFPQIEIGPDPTGVREYAQAAEALGYTHLLAYDHVIGADTKDRPNWRGPYTIESLFHEPFVLFGYLAGITERLHFVTGIIILPQRQTVLVAKQATEVDVLSGGKFRLGIGLGWNEVEYEALGENFHNRGRRSEEQIELLRRLFSEESVTFHGRWHHVEAAGLKPMPVQRPIPIWLGGSQDVTLRRIARLGDGWFPQMRPDERARDMVQQLREYTREAGRDAESIGIEARLSMNSTPRDEWRSYMEAWRELGATHLGVNTMGMGLQGAKEHIGAIRELKDATG